MRPLAARGRCAVGPESDQPQRRSRLPDALRAVEKERVRRPTQEEDRGGSFALRSIRGSCFKMDVAIQRFKIITRFQRGIENNFYKRHSYIYQIKLQLCRRCGETISRIPPSLKR